MQTVALIIIIAAAAFTVSCALYIWHMNHSDK